MANLRLDYNGKTVGDTMVRNWQRNPDKLKASLQATAIQAANKIIADGRKDIQSAGNFGPRWTSGLRARVNVVGDGYEVAVSHNIPYFGIFQKGGVIRGNPLLWIPLSYTGFKGGSVRAFPGDLIKITSPKTGLPLLISRADNQPKFVGKPQVTIKKKFHIVEIIRGVSNQLPQMYKTNFQSAFRT